MCLFTENSNVSDRIESFRSTSFCFMIWQTCLKEDIISYNPRKFVYANRTGVILASILLSMVNNVMVMFTVEMETHYFSVAAQQQEVTFFLILRSILNEL